MRYLIVAVLTLSLIICRSSLVARDLTLSQALELARSHSLSLKQVQALSEAARDNYRSARAERYPTLSLAAAGYYVSEVPVLDINVMPGVSFTKEFGTSETYQTDLRLALPLFTGGKISGGIDLARAGVEYAEAFSRMESDRLDFLTRVEYFNLYRAGQILDIARASLKRTEIILKDINTLYKAGMADSVDILDARLAYTRAESAVTQARTGRRTAEIRLLTMLGLDLSESLNITSLLQNPEMSNGAKVLPESKAELAASRANININRSRLKLARSNYFPTLSAYTGYSYGKPNLDRFNNEWNDYYIFGANLTWSFNIGGKNIKNASNARYNLEAAGFAYEQLYENLNRELAMAVETLNQAFEKYISAQKESRLTEDNYRLAGEKHRRGALTANRLLEIETTLTVAQSSLAAALVDYHIALSNFYYASGSPQLREGK
ncbi:MAG: TolC family protein [candidate division Zixibacteria bacterium]|nr:TolC family protein [candidate division Zixibacteria bacterium]